MVTLSVNGLSSNNSDDSAIPSSLSNCCITSSPLAHLEQSFVQSSKLRERKLSLAKSSVSTGNLDPALSQEIVDLFQQFNDVGVTVLLATHDIELLRNSAHRRIALARGCIEAIG